MLRQRTFAAVAAYFAGLAAGRPTVLVLEDLHWADPTSIELTQALMPLTDEVPLMLLLQFRPLRDEPSWHVHEAAARDFAHRYTAIELEPLDGAASEELIANLLKVEGLTDSVRALILNKAEGNPFFVEEVIRSLLDTGIIVGEDDRFVATSDIDTFAVPDTLAAVLATRLDALAPEERKVVQAAAVIGREFSFDMLEELTDVGVDLDQVVRDLLRREIVVDQPGSGARTYFFKHALTRDTAYETLLQGVRTDLHRLVGKLIEERDPDRVTELAHHFTEAGEPSLAFPYLVAAGDVELHAFAATAAVDQYRKALEAFGQGDDAKIAAKAFEGLAQALIFSGDIPAAIETYGEMLAFGEREVVQEIQVSALNKRALAYTNITGDLVSAEADLLLAKKIGEACGYQAGIAEFHTVYCALNTVQGNLDTAEEHLKDAVELGTEIDSTFTRNFGLSHHAQTLALMGRFAEAGHAVEEALPIIEASGDRLHHGEIIGITRSFVKANLGDPKGGLADARWGAGELNEIGAIFVEPIPTFNVALLAMQLGLLEESLEAWQRTMAIGEMFGDNGLIAGAAAGMAAVRTFIYGPADVEARRLKDLATTHVVMPGGESLGHVVLATLARMALIGFDVETAKKHLVAVEPMRSPLEALIRPEILMAAADIAMAEGSAEDAAGFVDEFRQLVQERGAVILEPRALQYDGLLQIDRGEFDDAVQSFDAAVDQASGFGLISEVLAIQFRAAMMLGAAGRTEAQRFGEGAADTVAEIAGLIEDPELRTAFLRTNATR